VWQQEPRSVFKEIQVGKIRVDQMVWESSVAVRLWVLGEGKTVRQETHEQKHGSRNLQRVLTRTQPQVRVAASVTPFPVSCGLDGNFLVIRQVSALRAYDGEVDPRARSHLVPVHSQGPHCSQRSPGGRKAEPLYPLWYQGFPLENSCGQAQNQTS